MRTCVVEQLRAVPAGLTKLQLVNKIEHTSPQTVQRVLTDLKGEGVIERDARSNAWHLCDRSFSLVLKAPQQDDLHALQLAAALLGSVADETLRARLVRLTEELDEQGRASASCASSASYAGALACDGAAATVTSATRTDTAVLRKLLMAVRRGPVRIAYVSPWRSPNEASDSRVVEPWQIRIHDGSAYLRAWDRQAGEARTFRVAQIRRVVDAVTTAALGAMTSRRPVPPPERLWGDADPALGIDMDRPDVARVQIGGPVARWLGPIIWHPKQEDRWLRPDALLERVVPYRSCREMARKVLSVIDAVEDIEPTALRLEVENGIRGYWAQVSQRRRRRGPRRTSGPPSRRAVGK